MKTIEEISEFFGDKHCGDCNDATMDRQILACKETAEYVLRWIPVSEELPEIEKHVDPLFEDEVDFERSKYVFLKVKGYPHPFVGFYVREAGKCFFDLMYTANEHIRQSDITHWRPIEFE